MKILFLTDNFPPEVNAGASRVYERACYWAKWGHDVTILTSAPNSPQGKVYDGYKNRCYQVEEMDGLRVVRVKTFVARNKGTFFRIVDYLSYMFSSFFAGLFQKGPDVIVASSPQFFTAVSAWGLSVFKRKPFVFEVADLWPESIFAVGAMKKNKFLSLLEKFELFLYRRACSVIALTPAFKKNMVSRGIDAEKIHVVINGVELDRYKPGPPCEDLLRQYHLNDCFVVGYIGTFGMAHGLENVLSAAEILKKHRDICFLLVGDGAERERLEAIVKQKKLDHVVMVPPQKKEDIADYWALCQVALVHLKDTPVFSTVIPSKIFEAMAVGLPILLACPRGEASSLVLREAVGMCVPPENPGALAQAVIELKEKSAYYELCVKNSLLKVSGYTREKQAREMLDILLKVEREK